MRLLIVGSGGREHALAWKLAQSPAVEELFVAPGNPGTADLAENLPIHADDLDGLLRAAQERRVDLTVVGPEVPLAAGIVDRFAAAGLRIFGPTQAAARIEWDKRYAKDLMARYGIPTGAYRAFVRFESALAYARAQAYPLVIKANGLAAGKGVVICATPAEAEDALRRTMLAHEFGAAGNEVVIEEFLQGQEASVLAFSDGLNVRTMPAAQDHKALLDGDRGPNTGGMGTYAPAGLVTPELLAQVESTIVRPAILALRNEKALFRGVLFAGLMLTPQGPKVLEFNARFGDPETQVILPLLESDLLPVLQSCLDGTLERAELQWSNRHAMCVVLASGGYPGNYDKGIPITGLGAGMPETVVFHAGTAERRGQVVTAGGRVLGVTGIGDTLAQAAERAYARVGTIHFDGMTYRRDIGRNALGNS